jgi:hypothetical protein
MASQIRLLLKTRKEADWLSRVMVYPTTKENGQLPSRVVFNSVPPDLAEPMCAWLACDGWTYGPCVMVPKPEDVP